MGDQFAVATRQQVGQPVRSAATRPPSRVDHHSRRRDEVRGLRAAAQPRLLVGPAGDPFEQEADRTADSVMAGTHSAAGRFGVSSIARSLLRFAQRAIGKAETPTKKDDDDKPKHAQKTPSGMGGPDVVPAGIEAGLTSASSGGQSLPARPFFESRFGFDFSDIRVHSGPEAAGAASALGARAFTVGNHIYFGAGELRPTTHTGRRLIAHELTHTIQQKGPAARAARLMKSPLRVQRIPGMPDSISESIRNFVVKDFPPWDLITLIIGFDPIRDVAVKGGFRDWLHAALKIVPNGEALFDKLDKEGKIEAVQKWWDAEIAKLDLTLATVTDLVKRGWDAVSGLDVLDPVKAWNDKIKPILAPTINRVINFVKAFGAKVFEVVKDIVLNEVGEWAKSQKGYPLLTMVLGRDPVTGEPVTPTLKGVIFAVLDLVDGGDKIKENLEKSKTIEKAASWFKAEVKTLDLTWEGIKLLFSQAWDAFKVVDLLNPKLLLEKMWAIFGPPVTRLINFLIAVGKKVLEFIFEGAMLLAGPIGLRIVGIVRKIGATFQTIVADPIAFLGHLVAGMKKGVQQFATNIWEHLKTGVFAWLTGALEGAGVVLPKVWDLRGIIDLVLQILGISYAKVRVKLVKVLGEKTVSMLETVFGFLKTLVTEGPAAAWKEIVAAIGSLWDLVIGGIKDWATSKIVTAAITKLVSMLNPAGAVIQAIIAVYNTVAFFIERINQILDFVQAVVDSIANLAEGKIAAAANWIEKAMAKSIPVLLGFLARLIGLGNVSEQIKKIITGIQAKVDKGIDSVIAWIVAKAKSLVGAVKDKAGKLVEWWRSRSRFHTADDEDHELSIESDSADAEIIIRSSPQKLTAFFTRWSDGIKRLKDKDKRTQQDESLGIARAVAKGVGALQKKLAAKAGLDEQSRQKEAAALNSELARLAQALAKHDVGGGPPYPPAILPAFVSGVGATSFRSEFITKALLDKGTKPAPSHSPPSWPIITKYGLSKNSKWVRMHVLTAALGGRAADSNLVPALGVEVNQVFDRTVETPAYKALKKGEEGGEGAIWYDVKLAFHSSTEKYGSGFPSFIRMGWGGYEDKNGKWSPKAESGGNQASPALPDLSGEPEKLDLNTAGRYRVRDVLGITELPARRIVEMRQEGWFGGKRGAEFALSADDFVKRVKAYNKMVGEQVESKARDPNVVTY